MHACATHPPRFRAGVTIHCPCAGLAGLWMAGREEAGVGALTGVGVSVSVNE